MAGEGLRTGLHDGIEADVIRVSADDVFDLTAGGFLAPLDDFVARDLDFEDLAPAVTTARSGPGGEVTALSVGAAYLGVFYNEAHLESVGVEPPSRWEDPWSIDEFEVATRRLTAADEDRVDRFGLAAVPWWTRAALADAAGLGGAEAFFVPDQTRSTMHSPTHGAHPAAHGALAQQFSGRARPRRALCDAVQRRAGGAVYRRQRLCAAGGAGGALGRGAAACLE